MNRITLYLDNGSWMAYFSGPHSDHITRLFGTPDMPTAFRAGADPESVLAFTSRAWPDAIVTLEVTQ